MKIPHIFLYAFVGGLTAIVDISLFYLLIKYIGFNWFLSSIIIFFFVVLINYKLGLMILFKRKSSMTFKSELISVYLISLLSLLLNLIILYVLIELLFINEYVSKVLSTGIVFLWNYFSRVLLVFNFK